MIRRLLPVLLVAAIVTVLLAIPAYADEHVTIEAVCDHVRIDVSDGPVVRVRVDRPGGLDRTVDRGRDSVWLNNRLVSPGDTVSVWTPDGRSTVVVPDGLFRCGRDGNPRPTPTPSPSPEVTPSPSPTPSPSVSPSPQPTPQPSPSTSSPEPSEPSPTPSTPTVDSGPSPTAPPPSVPSDSPPSSTPSETPSLIPPTVIERTPTPAETFADTADLGDPCADGDAPTGELACTGPRLNLLLLALTGFGLILLGFGGAWLVAKLGTEDGRKVRR